MELYFLYLNSYLVVYTIFLFSTGAGFLLYFNLSYSHQSNSSNWLKTSAYGVLSLATIITLGLTILDTSQLQFTLLNFALYYLASVLYALSISRSSLSAISTKSNLVFFASFLPLINNIVILVEYYQNYRKTDSRQDLLQGIFWATMLALTVFHLVGSSFAAEVGAIYRLFDVFGGIWIFAGLIKLVAATSLYMWVQSYLTFRLFAKVYLSISTIIFLISIVSASLIALVSIVQTEDQILGLMGDNLNLARANITEIEQSHRDIINVIKINNQLAENVDSGGSDAIQRYIDQVLDNNHSIDRVVVTDANSILLYDSDRPDTRGISVSSTKTTTATELISGLMKAEVSSVNHMLEKQTASVIGEAGSIVLTRKLDDSYLDYLKAQSGQEFMIYVDGSRTATTALASAEQRRLENLPDFRNSSSFQLLGDRDDDGLKTVFAKGLIYDTPYYFAYSQLETSTILDNTEKILLTAHPQKLILEAYDSVIVNSYLVTLLLLSASMLPIYITTRNVVANN